MNTVLSVSDDLGVPPLFQGLTLTDDGIAIQQDYFNCCQGTSFQPVSNGQVVDCRLNQKKSYIEEIYRSYLDFFAVNHSHSSTQEQKQNFFALSCVNSALSWGVSKQQQKKTT
ncbi:MAG: hypothetical protein OXC40_00770, partial [Proteobacteria bacterium]|nr:hypothetical protein [Pseudomonadota bacterium]